MAAQNPNRDRDIKDAAERDRQRLETDLRGEAHPNPHDLRAETQPPVRQVAAEASKVRSDTAAAEACNGRCDHPLDCTHDTSGPGGPEKRVPERKGPFTDRYSARYVIDTWGVHDDSAKAVVLRGDERMCHAAARELNRACDRFLKFPKDNGDRHPHHDVEAIFTLIRQMDDAHMAIAQADRLVMQRVGEVREIRQKGKPTYAAQAAYQEASDISLAKTAISLKIQRQLLNAWRAPWPNVAQIPEGYFNAVYDRCTAGVAKDIGLGAQDAPKRTEALSPSGQTYRGNELTNTPIDDCGIPIRDDRVTPTQPATPQRASTARVA